ncbi:hypothetical protein P167DRAFT_540462, partial [Morchella conica CCBAS932]
MAIIPRLLLMTASTLPSRSRFYPGITRNIGASRTHANAFGTRGTAFVVTRELAHKVAVHPTALRYMSHESVPTAAPHRCTLFNLYPLMDFL